MHLEFYECLQIDVDKRKFYHYVLPCQSVTGFVCCGVFGIPAGKGTKTTPAKTARFRRYVKAYVRRSKNLKVLNRDNYL